MGGRSGDVVPREDLECLLQGLNLLLPAPHALLVGDPGVDACGLQLLVVVHGGLQLLLRGLELLLGRMQVTLLVRLGSILVLALVLLQRLVLLRLEHELVVLVGLRSLRAGGLGLQAGEVGQDDLQEVHDVAALRQHALVGLVEGLGRVHRGGLLGQRGGLGRPRVVLLQHGQGLLHGRLRLLGLLDGLLVGLLGCKPVRRRLGHVCIELADRTREVGDVLGELRDLRREVLGPRAEGAGLGAPVLAGLLVRHQLRVAPALVLRLGRGLLHELHDEVLDELLDLAEGVGRHALRDLREQPAAAEARAVREEGGDALLQRALLALLQLREGRVAVRTGLDERRQVLLPRAGHGGARDDLNRLLQRRDLVGPQSLAALEVVGLLAAERRSIAQVLGVLRVVLGRRRQVSLHLGLQLLRLSPGRCLLRDLMVRVLRVVLELLHDHLVRMLRLKLLAHELRPLVIEFVLQLLEHLHDAPRLELVGIGLRRLVEELVIGHGLDRGLCLLKEGRECGLRGWRQEGSLLHLEQGLHELRLRPVVGLLLQDANGLRQGVDGLGEVLERRPVVGLLLRAHVRGGGLVLLPAADVLLELRNAVRERPDAGIGLQDAAVEQLHALRALGDLPLLDPARIAAPLREGSEPVRLLFLLLLALRQHVVHEGEDLLDRRYRGFASRGESGNACSQEQGRDEERRHLQAHHRGPVLLLRWDCDCL
mmetsp:Transcript_136230/g.423333  ORF Transcript_136230/g.423333 Transcript_136230/m.423333 type:complete len:709 (-) Transcript_136230:8-2134(-)